MERWRLSAELSEAEQRVVERLKRTGRFYVFLRQVAPRLFDDGFQARGSQHIADTSVEGFRVLGAD